MTQKNFFWLCILTLLMLALAACSRNNAPPPTAVPINVPTLAPVAAATQPAAPTQALIPTATSPAPQVTVVGSPLPPTQQPQVQPTVPIEATVAPTPAPGSAPTAVPPPAPPACTFKANFIGDVTIPDNTVIPLSTPFVKTWRVQNVGNCPWGPGSALHSIAFVGGSQMGAPAVVELPAQIQPGGLTDISIPMTAPDSPGSYKGNWKLKVDDGTLVGVGPGNVPLYVLIQARSSAPPPPPPPPTGAPSAPTRITFAAGATEAAVQGTLGANSVQDFIINAQAGQTMMLTLSSNNPMRVTVIGATPERTNPEGTYWQGVLPTTQDYIIRLTSGPQAANYGLNITIPQRITFAPGGISATVTGTTSANRVVTYLLKASGGQTMTANLVAPPNTVGLTIYGLTDGIPLVRAVSGATSWTGVLPATQDYVIQVVPQSNGVINFSLQVTVQ